MPKRLSVDLDICYSCPECVIQCSYFYHPGNNGITELREKGTALTLCRHCERGSCVLSCPTDALERPEDGILRRHSMLCIKCHSCVIACPFGTLLEETVPFAVSACDVCVGRCDDDHAPTCVDTCPYNALRFEEVAEDLSEDRYLLRQHVVVHMTAWKRDVPVAG